MNKSSRTPGISRIDQPEKRTHGFFVRMQRRGKMYNAFFTDLRYGGRAKALAAAQKHQRRLAAKLGTPVQMSRRQWANIRRRKTSSGTGGVCKVVNRQSKPPRKSWLATWSPEPHVVRRKMFSIKKFGNKKAKLLAIRARRAGLRQMQP